MSKIAVAIMVDNVESALLCAVEAKAQGADLVEFRVDLFLQTAIENNQTDKALEGAATLAENSFLPCIITCRLEEEGGAFTGRSNKPAGQVVGRRQSPLSALAEPVGRRQSPLSSPAEPVGRRQSPPSATAEPVGRRQSPLSSLAEPVGRRQSPLSSPAEPVGRASRPPSATADESMRIALIEKLSQSKIKPAYIDIELAAWQREPALKKAAEKLLSAGDTSLILSAHDFQTRPDNLRSIVKQMAKEKSCAVIKLAWKASSLRDNLEAFEIIAQNTKPTIAVCMGEFALSSRVLAGKFSALLTFAALDEKSSTAPGQPTAQSLKQDYHFDKINKNTKLFGVVGYPVGHSLSPAIHNSGFVKTDFDGVYLPLPIAPEYEHFKATIGSFLEMHALDFTGCSVTIPHKKNLLQFVKEQGGEIEPLAERIGAANTLTRRKDGSLFASNTDYQAALDSVCAAMSISKEQLREKCVAVLGAGGVARAIVAGFSHFGAKVAIYNRTLENAKLLSDEFNSANGAVIAKDWKKRQDVINRADEADIIINCTPIGMYPKEDASPLEINNKELTAGKIVFDTIYNPAVTKLLKDAQSAGCTIVKGEQMFIRQAAKQFELWTRLEAPLDTFKKAMHV